MAAAATVTGFHHGLLCCSVSAKWAAKAKEQKSGQEPEQARPELNPSVQPLLEDEPDGTNRVSGVCLIRHKRGCYQKLLRPCGAQHQTCPDMWITTTPVMLLTCFWMTQVDSAAQGQAEEGGKGRGTEVGAGCRADQA